MNERSIAYYLSRKCTFNFILRVYLDNQTFSGCDIVIATHSVGSLVEEYKPTDFVLLDQVIDRTQKRELSFYDCKPSSFAGVFHASFGDSYDTVLRQVI